MRINENLTKIMTEKNIGVHDISRGTDIHHSSLYRILNGENKNPRIKTIIMLADYLEVTIDQLVR